MCVGKGGLCGLREVGNRLGRLVTEAEEENDRLASERDKFEADLNEDMGEEGEGDPAEAIEAPTPTLVRGDLPNKYALKTSFSEVEEAGMKTAADKGEHDVVTSACRTFRQLVLTVRSWATVRL